MASLLLKSAFASAGAIYAENKYGPDQNLFAVTPLIVIGVGFWSVTHGFVVGKARSDAMAAAKKDGEKDVEERYNLPNLYAQGTSKHVRVFNTVQRSHQHIFETYPTFVVSALVGAQSFPIAAGLAAFTYAVGRITLTNCYAAAEGDPTKRYSSPMAVYNWYGLIMSMMIGMASCVKMIVDAHN